MEELEKNLNVSQLFYLYGSLLTENQQKMIRLYYEMDLSLKEIAEDNNISRNAVHDALKKGVEALKDYESKLHLQQKHIELEKKMKILSEQLPKEEFDIVYNTLKEDIYGI